LDLECSKGHGSFLLAEDAGSVIALDENERSIRYASSHFLKENLAFRKGSLSDQSREGQALFDVIIWFRSMSNITELEKQLPMIHRFLKEGGIFLVSLPNKRNDLSSLNYPLGYRSSLNEFKSLLDKYFEYTLMYGQKIYPSSNIFPLFNTSESSREYLVEKGEENFLFVSPERKAAEYFIAIASNQPLENVAADSYLIDASECLFKFKEAQIKSLEEELCDKEAHIENLELVMSEKDIHIGNLEAAIREKDVYIMNLEAALKDKEAHIENLERQREESYRDWQAHEKNLRTIIEDKDTHIGNLERQREQNYRDWQTHEKNLRTIIEDKDTHIGNLERQREENYRDWQDHVGILEKTLQDKEQHIENLEAIRKGRETHIGNLEAALRDKDAHIGNLEAMVRDKDAHIGRLEVTVREKEATLNRIYNSYGLGALLICNKMIDKLFPFNSKRRRYAKTILNTIKHPKNPVKNSNKSSY